MVQNDYILKGKKKANFITLIYLIIIVLISYLLCTFVLSIYIIQENSMYPTLKNNNYIFVEKVTKYFSIKQEDIIIFNNDGRTLIKRVIALFV
jgi:signal peptidase I